MSNQNKPNKLTLQDTIKNHRELEGEVEIIIKDRLGRVIDSRKEKNIIKVFAKEMLSHRISYSKIWDPGTSAWQNSNIDADEEFSIKYILFGASFDDNGNALDQADTRYYVQDSVTGGYVTKSPEVGADNQGDLINAIPISEPDRPLKKVEAIYYEPSYQPSDTPLLDETVRAVNNILVVETTLRTDEYNGFASSGGDFFTITEVALAGGKTITGDLNGCECNPRTLFLEGVDGTRDTSIASIANEATTITIKDTVAAGDVNRIKEGDQILIVGVPVGTSETYDLIGQTNPYYLVASKSPGGRDLVLDRTPVDSDGNPLTGDIAIYRSSLRIFSQRILSTPFKKTSAFEITIRWRVIFN